MDPVQPARAARETLSKLLAQLIQENPDARKPDVFFPVRVERVPPLLGWSVDRVSQAGIPMYGDLISGSENVHGIADFETHRIVLSTQTLSGTDVPDTAIRFTLAHEIGHICLHADRDIWDMRRRQVRSRRILQRDERTPLPVPELQANAFAAELLMPERAVRRQFSVTFGDQYIWSDSGTGRLLLASLPEGKRDDLALARAAATHSSPSALSLAAFFGVSTSAMAIRLTRLDLVRGWDR